LTTRGRDNQGGAIGSLRASRRGSFGGANELRALRNLRSGRLRRASPNRKPKKKKIKTISKIEPERRKFFSMNEMLR